ncbi:hypothetical protein GCM10028812_43560 [Ancylobacter sonchi]
MGLEMLEMRPLAGGALPVGAYPPMAFGAAHALRAQAKGVLYAEPLPAPAEGNLAFVDDVVCHAAIFRGGGSSVNSG